MRSLSALAMMENKRFLVFFSLALAVGFLSIAFVLIWVLHFREGLGWDGGSAEFNWHPLLMLIGFIFLQGIGKKFQRLQDTLFAVYRLVTVTSYATNKADSFT